MSFELNIMQYIYQNLRTPFLDNLMVFFTSIGELGLFWLIIGVILIFFKKYRKYGIMLIISLIFVFIVGEFLLKNLICRVRPCYMLSEIKLLLDAPKGFSFPSSHAATSFSSSWILFKVNKKIGVCGIIIAYLIGFSRVYLFAHFPTDVLGGALIGILCAEIVYVVCLEFVKNRGEPTCKNLKK